MGRAQFKLTAPADVVAAKLAEPASSDLQLVLPSVDYKCPAAYLDFSENWPRGLWAKMVSVGPAVARGFFLGQGIYR
jgi:hypothetical protein